MSAADASSLNFWSWVSLVGIILVIVGVVLEGAEILAWLLSWLRRKRSEIVWRQPPEVHIPKWVHISDRIGWCILLVGLALEWMGHVDVEAITSRENRRVNSELGKALVIAGAANERAARLELENLVLRSNVVALELNLIQVNSNVFRIEPLNRPILSITASAWFTARTTNFTNIDPVKDNSFVTLSFGVSEEVQTNYWKIQLRCRRFEKFNNSEFSFFVLEFGVEPSALLHNVKESDSVRTVDRWDIVFLQAFFLRLNTEILRGQVTLIINSTFKKTFEILPQITKLMDRSPRLMDGTTSNDVTVRIVSAPVP